ncbi:hypothetical protein FBU30_001830 [Linnemannia zychae]|nr:hypothetical protein FBU30_001830 [Linnemannia zychae]
MFFKRLKKNTPLAPTPRALEIPEILDRIFFFIDDEQILSHSIILVCRRWLWMNQHRLLREACWTDTATTISKSNYINLNKAITRLPRATQLVWSSSDRTLQEKNTQRLIQALCKNNDFYLERLRSDPTDNFILNDTHCNGNNIAPRNMPIERWMDSFLRSQKKMTPLPKGVLRELDLTAFTILINRILPYLSSLTTLKLHLPEPQSVQLHTVINACPHLLALRISASSIFYLPNSWKPSTNTVLGVEPINQNGILPLKSLVFENACFKQNSLEEFLILTPHLLHLQLRNLKYEDTTENNVYSWPELLRQLKTLSLPLRSIHFSVYGQLMSIDEEQEKVFLVSPKSTEWAFRSFDLTPTLTSCLRQLSNVVTTLEIVSSEGRSFNDHALALHQYLCASPHLLHLKASNSVILVERMDIHQRWNSLLRRDNDIVFQDLQTGIWACRNLRTLHIRVHSLGHPSIRKLPLSSRIVFGYISIVLPQLRDLQLFDSTDDYDFSLSLFGGLCLLARLRHLESFILGDRKTLQQIRIGDVRWMVSSGQNRVGRMERLEIIAIWGQLLNAEQDIEKYRRESVLGYTAPTIDNTPYTEPEILRNLAQLGLLLDVKLFVDQMNSKGYQSWPKLKYLSVYQKQARRPITRLEKGFEVLIRKNLIPIDSRANDDTAFIMGGTTTEAFYSQHSMDRMGLFSFSKKKNSTASVPSSSPFSGAKSKVTTPSKPTPKALLLPAVIHRIFDYLQDDSETLHQSVILVCRQWYYLNQSRISRELIWIDDVKYNNSKSYDKLATRLPQANKLVWQSNDSQLKNKYTIKLLQALEGNKARYEMSLDPSTAVASKASGKKSKTPLKTDGFLHHFDLTYSGLLFLKVLPFLQSLKSLRLQIVGSDTFRFNTVFAACSNLESLQIVSTTGVIQAPSPWIPQSSTTPLPLQTLILESTIFSQSELENLLKLTPHLKTLQLRNLRESAAPSTSQYSWYSLVDQLRINRISLLSIHFSIYGQPIQNPRDQIVVVAPRSSEWAFRSYDLTSTVTSYLREVPNFVTSLEIISSKPQQDSNYGLELHQFLCVSPHLLHLKATHSVCLIERMDIHRRWSPSFRSGITVDRTAGIWVCRNLRTLHIRVHNLGSSNIQDSPVRSRILFGYISRVLPKLRDLFLYEQENEPGLSLDLFGGLCFLARLRHLESFRLGTDKNDQMVRPGDISWMIPSGNTSYSKSDRSEVVLTWNQLLIRDKSQEAQRLSNFAGRDLVGEMTNASLNAKISLESELVTSLADLGLLEDVKILTNQMNSKQGFVSWPKLKFLTIYQPLTQTYTLQKGYIRVGRVAASDLDSRINDDIGAMMK